MTNPPSKLMNRNFFLLWQGQLVSQMGSSIFNIAMIFWIKQATGSATLMGTIAMVSTLPAIIFGPIGGTFADRYSRRLIIIFCDIFNGLAILSFTGLIFLCPERMAFILIWLFIVSVLCGIAGSFFRPAISASIPDIVPFDKIPAANSLRQSSFQISTIFGQGLGGLLFRLLGLPMLALIDGATFLFSALSESFIAIPQKLPEKAIGLKQVFLEFKRDFLEGFGFVWRRMGMRILIFGAAVLNFFAVPISILLPFYVEDYLHARADWYGYLLASLGLGAMIGYLLVGIIKLSGKTTSHLYIILMALLGVIVAILGYVSTPLIALVIFFIAGVMNGFLNVIVITIFQKTTPTEIRGRVFGLLDTIGGGIMPISMGLTGIVADMLDQNIPLIFAGCGIIISLIIIIMSLNKAFRDFLAYEEKHEATQISKPA